MDKYAESWQEAAVDDFYPDVSQAVGAPLSVLLTQFPSLYYGLSRGGYPCCYFNAGKLSVEGIECFTDCDKLPRVIWYTMMHDLKYQKFPAAQRRNPQFQRCVNFCATTFMLSRAHETCGLTNLVHIL